MRRARRFALLVPAVAFAILATASSSSAAFVYLLTLTPASATNPVGGSHTLTASLRPAAAGSVTFTVISGPNAGKAGTGTLDANGNTTYTYSSSTAGTDTLQATYTVVTGGTITSNTATATWSPLPKTDPKVTMTAPGYLRLGKTAAFSSVVTNGGPDTTTGVQLRATLPAGATLASASSTVGSCSGGPIVTCVIGTLGAGASATVTIVLSALSVGSLTLSASVQGDYDTNTGNNSASATTAVIEQNAVPPAPPASSQPGTFNAVGTGTILVNGGPRDADQQFVLNSGDVVDVGTGIITFTDSNGKYGSWSSEQLTAQRATSGAFTSTRVRTAADSVASKFQVQQPATAGAPTTLSLVSGDFSVCNAPRSVAAKSKKPVRQLWGSAKGTFLTKGRFSAASVRGTVWLVQDRCDGTLTQVVEGVVDVVDVARKKTVSVGPGQSYLALAPVPLVLPKQTPAQVARRGLVWGTKTYPSRQALEKYLKTQGYTWAQFAKRYPGLAAALAKRR